MVARQSDKCRSIFRLSPILYGQNIWVCPIARLPTRAPHMYSCSGSQPPASVTVSNVQQAVCSSFAASPGCQPTHKSIADRPVPPCQCSGGGALTASALRGLGVHTPPRGMLARGCGARPLARCLRRPLHRSYSSKGPVAYPGAPGAFSEQALLGARPPLQIGKRS